MLTLDSLHVAYDGVPAVVDASLEVPDGSVVAVLGPSGCGKSTLLRAVAGLEQPSAGTISWDGTDLSGTPTHRRGFALMFQDGQLFGHLTVARNVGYALRIARGSRQARPPLGARVSRGAGVSRGSRQARPPGGGRTSRAGERARVAELLALVGLEGYADRLPATLSGGERQRVALARSLAADPRLLLLDEPLSALDAGLRERLAADLQAILRSAGTTTLVVTHDQEEAFALADRLVVMREGRIVQQGLVGDVWARPADATTALFLGYARVIEARPAGLVLAAAGLPEAPAVAVRRSALGLDPLGTLRGTVLSARATPDQLRLVVTVDEVGEVDAVAGPGAHAGPGDEVRLSVDPARCAALPRGDH